jgi:hypothetical protein
MQLKDSSLALAIGSIVTVALGVIYGVGLVAKGRPDAVRALLYNLPIAFVFLVIGTCLTIRVIRMGLPRFLTREAGSVLLWIVGFGVLYLRLVSKELEVSGHLAWLPMLTVQAWLLGLPGWFVAVGVGATASAAYLKFMVFQGPSGGPGLAIGVALAGAIYLASRRNLVDERQTGA